MLQNGTQIVLRMYIKSIKFCIWGIFGIKMVFEEISDTIFDNFKQLFRAISSEMVPKWCLECIKINKNTYLGYILYKDGVNQLHEPPPSCFDRGCRGEAEGNRGLSLITDP